MTAQAPNAPVRPWYLTALLGASAWIAGLLLLLGIVVVFTPDTQGAATTLGVLLLTAAFGLFIADRQHGFLAQFGLCLSIAGQCLLIYGLSGEASTPLSIALTSLLVQLALAALMPNRTQRMLSTLFALIAWAIWLQLLAGDGDWGTFWGARSTPSAAGASDLIGQLGWWFLTWLPPGAALWWLLRTMPKFSVTRLQEIALPIVRGLIVGIAAATALADVSGWFGVANSNTVGLWPLLSVLAAVVMVGASFRLHSAALIGFTTLCAFVHLGHFYYDLGVSLLMKSLLMIGIGVLCLAARGYCQTRWRIA